MWGTKLLFKKDNKKFKALILFLLFAALTIPYLKRIHKKKIASLSNGSLITALHTLNINKIDHIAEGHIALLSSNKNEIKFLHLSLGAPLSKETKNGYPDENIALSLGIYDLDHDRLTFKSLGNIEGGIRGTDVYISKYNQHIFISYIFINDKNQASIMLDEIHLNSDSTFSRKNIFQTIFIDSPFGVHESGGIIEEDDRENLFFTIGDFEKGYITEPKLSPFGKILVKSKNENIFRIYSSGHRNPQGLFWDDEKKILIETEHGPQGGDEINIIKKDKNYGWPLVTYGRDYGLEMETKPSANRGTVHYGFHEGFEKPIYAFIPSIGIKSIVKLDSNKYEFTEWKNDYLIASRTALFRVAIEKERVVYAEPISGLHGIRDLKIIGEGMVIASNDQNQIILVRRDVHRYNR